MQLQVTLIDKTNKYKPLSTLVDIPSIKEYNENKTKYLKSAIQKICCKMRISVNTFKQDYDIKARIYALNFIFFSPSAISYLLFFKKIVPKSIGIIITFAQKQNRFSLKTLTSEA